ncbi:MAG: hypothetical protein AB4290_24400 [Spirulina sp.]
MTTTANLPVLTGVNTLKTLNKSYVHNLHFNYTEKIQSLSKAFHYQNEKYCYWSDPKFSLFYGSALYEQASSAQKLALNHLFWTLFYKIAADREIEFTHYNLIAARTLLAMGTKYKTIAEYLKYEKEQERVRVRSFYQVFYDTHKLLFRKPQGLFNSFQGKTPSSILQFIVRNWVGSPFLTCHFYGIRYLANLLLKNYEYTIVQQYDRREKQSESIPIASYISYYHFLDEGLHPTTSLFIGRDLYRQFFSPSASEQWVANLAFYRIQRENFANLSAIFANRFISDRTLLPHVYQLLQSPLFQFSPQETLHWLEQCLCQEHEGWHSNWKLHQNLLEECRNFTSKLNYLWPVNREMRLMSAGGSIANAIAQNKKAFQQFARSA